MNKQNKFFKVTTEAGYSPMKEGTDIAVKYNIGEWTTPKINQLMVFASKNDAIFFYKKYIEYSPLKIYECEVKNPALNGFWCSEVLFKVYMKFLDTYSQRHKSIYAEMMEDESIADKIKNYGRIPKGTVFCDAVMLTKELTIK